MFKWALPTVFIALLSASGCCCGPRPCGPLGMGLICKPGCGVECGHACGPSCGAACAPTGGACAPCGPSLTCSTCCGGLKYWLNGRCYAGRSCGNRYWGEWVSDPPDCCDPCNQCGNFVGPNCCGPGPLMRLWSSIFCCNSCGGAGCGACCGSYGVGGYGGVHGYGGGAYAGGCSTCGHGGQGAPGDILHENWEHQSQPPVPGKNIPQAQQPTPAYRTSQRPQPVSTQISARPPAGRVQQATMMRR